MKYGVNMLAWTMHVGAELEPLFFRMRGWGFDGVEIFVSPQEPASAQPVKRLLDRANLERTTCSVLPRDANLVSPQHEVRARARRRRCHLARPGSFGR